ncbi:hypothetical protein KJ562_00005 [Patescibacteria group bacterium]|nr:hypothetical protein [Patescibacteria group bacterium]
MSKVLIIVSIIILILICLSLLGIVRFVWNNEDMADEYTLFATTCKYRGIAIQTGDRVVPILPIIKFCMPI